MIRISDIISGLKGKRKLHPKQQLILAEVLAEVRKYGKCTPWTPFLTSGQPIAWSLLWKGLCSDCWASTSVISLVPASEEDVLLVFANTILTSMEWRWETWLHGPWDPNAGWSSVEQAPHSQMMSVRSAKVNLSPQSVTASWPNFFQEAGLTAAFSICISTLWQLARGDSEGLSRCACTCSVFYTPWKKTSWDLLLWVPSG